MYALPDFLAFFTKIFPRIFVPRDDLSCNTLCLLPLACCTLLLLLSIESTFVDAACELKKFKMRKKNSHEILEMRNIFGWNKGNKITSQKILS